MPKTKFKVTYREFKIKTKSFSDEAEAKKFLDEKIQEENADLYPKLYQGVQGIEWSDITVKLENQGV